MSGTVLMIAGSPDEGGLLTEVLRGRGRPLDVRRHHDDLPTSSDGIRGLAVLPPTTDGPAPHLADLIATCHGAGVAVLGIGTGALAVIAAAGLATVGSVHTRPGLIRLSPTEQGLLDPVTATAPPGAWWAHDLAADISPVDPQHILAIDADGNPVILASGRTYAVLPRTDLPGPAVVDLIGAEAVPAGATRFLAAYAAALVGRWVDLVVGRSDEEMPWGRRGPRPQAQPGLVLNPT